MTSPLVADVTSAAAVGADGAVLSMLPTVRLAVLELPAVSVARKVTVPLSVMRTPPSYCVHCPSSILYIVDASPTLSANTAVTSTLPLVGVVTSALMFVIVGSVLSILPTTYCDMSDMFPASSVARKRKVQFAVQMTPDVYVVQLPLSLEYWQFTTSGSKVTVTVTFSFVHAVLSAWGIGEAGGVLSMLVTA